MIIILRNSFIPLNLAIIKIIIKTDTGTTKLKLVIGKSIVD